MPAWLLRDYVTSWLPNLPTEDWEKANEEIWVALHFQLRIIKKLSSRNIFVVLVQYRLILPLESRLVWSFDRQWSDTSLHLATQSSPRPLSTFWKPFWHSVSYSRLCLFTDCSVRFVMSYARILGATAAVSGGLYAYYRFRDSGQQVCKLHKLNLQNIQVSDKKTTLYQLSLTSLVHNCTLILAWVNYRIQGHLFTSHCIKSAYCVILRSSKDETCKTGVPKWPCILYIALSNSLFWAWIN